MNLGVWRYPGRRRRHFHPQHRWCFHRHLCRYLLHFFKAYCITLQRHNTENSKQIFPEKELRGYSPNSYVHFSVSDLYIPLISLPILLQENRCTVNVGVR
jgi:hypothetical protein